MENRTFLYAALVGIALLSILLIRSFLSTLAGEGGTQKYVHQNDVRGVEVIHSGKTYTMNLDQQKEFIKLLNVAVAVSKLSGTEQSPFTGVEKIIIHRFDKQEITLTPVDTDDEQIFFRAPLLNPDGYIMDISAGEMKALIEGVYSESVF